MRINARWTNDCGGKKDYDGDLVSISTRYWPEDGGFLIMRDGEFESPGKLGPCSAHSTIGLREGSEDPEDEYGKLHALTSKRFEGESFESVKAQVEAWADIQMVIIRAALETAFATAEKS